MSSEGRRCVDVVMRDEDESWVDEAGGGGGGGGQSAKKLESRAEVWGIKVSHSAS